MNETEKLIEAIRSALKQCTQVSFDTGAVEDTLHDALELVREHSEVKQKPKSQGKKGRR